ncbi:MAG TPA: hypothetical protein VK335_19655 [Bryobacteraceae bacterium]|nr:hypothetical protein [Bryobacteraceae bacterium]
MRWALALAVVPLLAATDPPRLFFSKSFPGSAPAYVEIALERNGNAIYKEAADDDLPIKFQVGESDTNAIFGLADKLGHFNHPLESPLKVAFMGMKTFRFEAGPEKQEVKFNYSEDPDAQALLDWFERISESEEHVINLERTVKYDKLGVNEALLLLQISYERKRLVAPQQFLPLLDRVVKNDSYMHMARERAAGLAEAIRAAK